MLLKDIDELKELSVRVGNVFRVECFPEDGVVPKEKTDISRHKYIVIAGIDSEGNYIGATLINSKINQNFAQIISKFQIEIFPAQYDFLGAQSRFIDCYKMISLQKERILQAAEYIGTLEDTHVCKVRELLKKSPIVDNSTIKRFNL